MTETMIEVRDLVKHYGAVRALDGITFSVPRGQIVGLLGPNGAGKTTAMRILTGYVAPTAGNARVDGKDVVEDSMECRRRIGYLPEGNPQYLDLRVEEVLAFAGRMYGLGGEDLRRAMDDSIEAAGLQGRRRSLVVTLSKGYRQRVGLAQALLHKPEILILDEPTSGLDPNQQEDMRNLIRSLGGERTIILSTHILPEVEAVCDRALIISRGRLVADGSVEEIRATALGGPTIVAVVRGDAEGASGALRRLPFVKDLSLAPLEGEGGVTIMRFHTEARPTRDEIETVAREVVGAGLALSRLDEDVASLEQTFAELTSGASTNGGASQGENDDA